MVALAGSTTLGFGQGHSGELQWLPNQGQWEVPALARADWAGGVTWLEEDGMNIWVAGEGYDELWAHQDDRLTAFDPEALLTSHGWQVHWEGSGPDLEREVLSEAGHRVNVYLGQDPSRWAEGLVPETRFKLHNVWPGIDLRVGPRTRGDQAELPGPGWKEDWIVHPGADAAKVAIRHEGASLSLLSDGSLRCQLGETAEARWGVPFAYQMEEGRLQEVEVRYLLNGSAVTFEVGDHNPELDLVIDPDIVFATYIGSSQPNWGFTAAYDDEGRALGGTALWNGDLGTYPTTAGAVSTAMTCLLYTSPSPRD